MDAFGVPLQVSRDGVPVQLWCLAIVLKELLLIFGPVDEGVGVAGCTR